MSAVLLSADLLVTSRVASIAREISLTVLAFGPHVDEAMLAAARQAGCDKVLARGQFLNQVAAVLLPYARIGLAPFPR